MTRRKRLTAMLQQLDESALQLAMVLGWDHPRAERARAMVDATQARLEAMS